LNPNSSEQTAGFSESGIHKPDKATIQETSSENIMKAEAGRNGYRYEQEMEAYRRYFTTGTKKTQYRNAGKLKAYCEWAKKSPEQLIQE